MLKQSYRVNGHAFGPDIPSKNLPFPSSARLTAVELLTFLPHCLHSPDVVYRLASNGCTRSSLRTIIMNNRYLEKAWSPDDCGRLVSKTMRQAGYKDWTIRTHFLWHKDRDGWDNAQLSTDGFKVPCQIDGDDSLAQSIAFRALATGVRTFPEGHDALDLTRMVHYALEHPEGQWKYPDDYDALLDMVGGPKCVEEDHCDRNAFRRWESKEAAPRQARPVPALPIAQHTSSVLGKSNTTPAIPDTCRVPENPRSILNPRTTVPHVGSMLDYDYDLLEDPLTWGWIGKRVSFASENIKIPGRAETEGIEITDNAHEHGEHAPEIDEVSKPEPVRNKGPRTVEEPSLAREECGPSALPHLRRHSSTADVVRIGYVPTFAPPPMPSVIAREEELEKAFREKRSKAQTDKYGAYAFGGGPRTSPPYRRLHRIHPPDSDDISWWAENIRWVAEQAEYFSGACMWDESPEHMEEITNNRIRQEWVSAEYRKRYGDDGEESSDEETRYGAPRRRPKERIVLPDVVPNSEKIAQYLNDCKSGPFPPPGETFFDLD